MHRLQQFLLVSLLPVVAFGCNGRTVIKGSTEGIISDGPNKYPESSHCEWLIEAPFKDQFITLEFTSFSTECSFDFLFVYDGNSYKSRLLGTFSGNRQPDTLSASSGYMLIFFYSDRNYMLNGFQAMFKVTDCPLDCSGRGECKKHRCDCHAGYFGESCQFKRNIDCHNHFGKYSFIEEACVCERGYAGIDCGLSLFGKDRHANAWNTLYPDGLGMKPRTGHASAFIESTNILWIFGGYDLNSYHNDLQYFDFERNVWGSVNASRSLWPTARHEHTIVGFGTVFYMYGGVLADGRHTNELWVFDTMIYVWKRLATSSFIQPLGVGGHTMTFVDNMWLYVYGGRLQNGSFSAEMYRIRVPDARHWDYIVPKGRKSSGRNLIGHSAVFHRESRSIVVFGGLTPNYSRFSKRVKSIYSYHVDFNYWSEIRYDMKGVEPKVRTFHSANVMGNYMVIYGGNCHIHSNEEICYDNGIYLYHLGCHKWVDITYLQMNFTAYGSKPDGGRFGHSAVVAYGNTLLITGGYRGNVFGDLVSFTVPPSIALHQNDIRVGEPVNQCSQYYAGVCLNDPECMWCDKIRKLDKREPDRSGCLHHTRINECLDSKPKKSSCPGICASLMTCTACTVQGQGPKIYPDSLSGVYYGQKCAWCVMEAVCRPCHEPTCGGACNMTESFSGKSNIPSWWGKPSPRVMEQEQCRKVGPPAGLLWIKHRPPINLDYPDEVSIIRETKSEYTTHPKIAEEMDKNILLVYKGFIHPMDAPSAEGAFLQVYMGIRMGRGRLYISTDASEANKEEVASSSAKTSKTYVELPASRQTPGSPIFPDTSRQRKYFMELLFYQPMPPKADQPVQSTMGVSWTGYTRHMISAEFLEPYNSNNCSRYRNCLKCMTDTSCGWCLATDTCVIRKSTALTEGECGTMKSSKFLILDAGECPDCSELISCQSCTENPRCEWLANDPRCTRRGRFDSSIREPARCNASCIMRKNCSACLAGNTECTWCDKLQTCFPFAEYIPRYIHGECAEWVDYESTIKCRDCSQHLNCKTCLSDYQCGWCGDTNNPTIGACIGGDFTGPYNNQTCTAYLQEPTAAWSYGVCPDVQECRLNLHDCHPNATCNNTFESFTCTCNQGFTGDGRKSCEKTCYYECINGNCSGAPDYMCNCEIGWTGENCSVNCGCYNHSTCTNGTGICDRCEHWTTGNHCELCQIGSYGNATIPTGCKRCDCHGHGVEEKGFCNQATGKCFCKDNTEGDHCERCQPGYYGNPRNGGKCYLKCEGRTLLKDVSTNGALGTYEGAGVVNPGHAYCLWVLSARENSSITFTIETDIKVKCSTDYVHVYDGLPDFIAGGKANNAVQIGAFCGQGLLKPISVEAKSGLLTVYFEANISQGNWTQGFNASYRVNHCSIGCAKNRVCSGRSCVCKNGYGGVDCGEQLCPDNCFNAAGHGYCNKTLGLCVCNGNYRGPACSETGPAFVEPYYDPWRMAWPDNLGTPLARMGHTMISCNGEVFYMFGGISVQRGILQDLWQFDSLTRSWNELRSVGAPHARYFHAAACVPALKSMFVYGGHTTESINSAVMWMYSIDNNHWKKKLSTGVHQPRAGHTMTLISDTKMIIIGGFSTENYYNDKIQVYDASTNSWRVLETTGAQPTGVYGHTAVYHEPSNAIYMYGGYEYQIDKTIPSDRLYALDLGNNRWSILSPPPPKDNHFNFKQKSPRYFHAAVTTDEYMVILGGRSKANLNTHFPVNEDFTADIQIYVYACNVYLDVTTLVKNHEKFTPRIGHAAVKTANGKILISGGYDGRSHGGLVELTLPIDFCSLMNDYMCYLINGCSSCYVKLKNKAHTYCYSNTDDQFKPTDLNCHNSIFEGFKCDKERIEPRDCSQHTSCMECTARYPIYPSVKNVCKWCSNCGGKCIAYNRSCAEANKCSKKQQEFHNSEQCYEQKCQASDCEKCKNKTCMWLRQFKWSGEVNRTFSSRPIYDWYCDRLHFRDITIEINPTFQSMPPDRCPKRCHLYKDCTTCLDSLGGEGGWQRCVWSQTLKQCIPPAFLPLHCTHGKCYHIIVSDSKQCPTKCSVHTQCSHCISTPGCGWCTLGKLKALDGIGVCMEGGFDQPKVGKCEFNWITLGSEPLPASVQQWINEAVSPPTWSFATCPAENECLNGHHTCRKEEQCRDKLNGFRCECKRGYKRSDRNKDCEPKCSQGCAPNGICVEPDVCKCNFGYVGHNCSTACDCNGHSDCESVQRRDVCLECKNNTKGTKCGICKPLYVGNPAKGHCLPCKAHCFEHADVCISLKHYNDSQTLSLPLTLEGVTRWVKDGATEDSVVCVNCKDNTIGDRCQSCERGHFRPSDSKTADACRKCECNGHSNECNEKDGLDCRCKNNTETRCGTGKDSSIPCQKQQCSDCKEYFFGKPTDGHQCYRQVNVDRDYCFDPLTQRDCGREPSPLSLHRTVFFVVQPKYLNVDIRITIDVSKGAVDVFFSPHEDTFVVLVDEQSGGHCVCIDPMYIVDWAPSSSSCRLTCARHKMKVVKKRRSKRAALNNSSRPILNINKAQGLTTFITVEDANSLLIVNDVQFRLVITLPLKVHNLRQSRFYIVLFAKQSMPNQEFEVFLGDDQSLMTPSSESYGNLFFRQDQPHIDLFVFFSVFFSCFFLFLDLCVLFWKIKQGFDERRNRQRREQEMENMASRPFARILVLMDDMPTPQSSPTLPRKICLPKIPNGSRYSHSLYHYHSQTEHTDPTNRQRSPFHVTPIALEPTDDGIAAVGTVMLQLPGGSNVPVRTALGSALITTRVMYPSGSSSKQQLRRRMINT
ncbi:multiple epidermal growth factor-like domains protein 8 [Tubulanus polymorphus]|uniref:multiple epidermal growth factor-like domains protein 8 n=1 Tax=Tubulanus polymorphus TaxID=672921 RepID=UPI003DA5EF41